MKALNGNGHDIGQVLKQHSVIQRAFRVRHRFFRNQAVFVSEENDVLPPSSILKIGRRAQPVLKLFERQVFMSKSDNVVEVEVDLLNQGIKINVVGRELEARIHSSIRVKARAEDAE